jgi:tetratricopeptide (TPR) repeat protein
MNALFEKKRRCVIFWTALVIAGFGCRRSVPVPKVDFVGMDTVVASQISNTVTEVKGAPRSATAWGKLGMVLKSAGLPSEAKTCFSEAERLDRKDPRWPYFQGTAESLRRAVALAPAHDFLRIRLGQVLVEAGGWSEAEEHFRAAAYSLGLGQIACAQQRWSDAVRHLDNARRNKYTAKAATVLLATAHLRLGRTNEARALAAEGGDMPPDPAWPNAFETEANTYATGKRAWTEQAQELLARNDLPAAAPIIERLVTQYPNAPEGWLYLGRACVMQSNWSAAEQALARHLQLDPPSVDGRLQMGLVYYHQKRLPNAAAEFVTVLKAKPDSQHAHYFVGQIRRLMHDREGAMSSFKEALRCDPTFEPARKALDELTVRQ